MELVLPANGAPERRRELGAFLRSRRARITPEDVGLFAGPRRRAPGLRREEVAQLASVGVTWYTWLEQGRDIHPSVDVLDAIARALRLDPPEREHMYRLADMAGTAAAAGAGCLDGDVQVILDQLQPLPASVMNARYDVLAWNLPYAVLFPGLIYAPPGERNALWQAFMMQTCPFMDSDTELPLMVATLRGFFGRHLGEPSWQEFVERLSAASPRFAELWSRHDVAEPANRTKRFRSLRGEEIRLNATSFGVTGTPETRMVVYTPSDALSATRLERELSLHLPGPIALPVGSPERAPGGRERHQRTSERTTIVPRMAAAASR